MTGSWFADLKVTLRRMAQFSADDRIYRLQQIGAVLVSSTVVLIYNTLPALIAVLRRDLGFTEAMTTAFTTAEMTGVGVGSVAGVAIMRWLSPRRTLQLSLVGLFLANLLSALVRDPNVVIAARLPGGFFAAVAIGAAYYIYGLRDYERNTGLNLLGTSSVTFIMLAPFSMFKLSAGVVFLAFAVILIPSFLLSRWFPTSYVQPTRKLAEARSTGGRYATMVRASIGLAGAVASTFSIGLFWTYLAPMTAHNGMTETAVATALSIGTGAAFFGALVVTAAGGKVRTPGALFAGTLVGMICLWMVGNMRADWALIAGVAGWYVCIPLLGAISLGYSMTYAPYARYAVYISAIRHVVLPAAPLVGAGLLALGGYASVNLASVLLMGTASTLLWLYVARSRAQLAASSSSPST